MTPACSTCGYAVDWLRSCYASQWKLFRNSDTLTPGIYYRNPAAPHYPGPHNLGSRTWISQEADPPPILGEQPPAVRPYSKGLFPTLLPPAVRIGSTDCIERGDTTPPTGVTQLIAGVDSRCWSSQGLPVPTAPLPQPMLWLTPAGLPPFLTGESVPSWPDVSGFKNTPVQLGSSTAPTLKTVGLGGLPACHFVGGHFLHWPVAVPLSTAHSVYVVGTISPTGFTQAAGPTLYGIPTNTFGAPYTVDNGMAYAHSPLTPQVPFAAVRGQAYAFWARRQPSTVELGGHNLAVGNANISPTLGLNLSLLGPAPTVPSNQISIDISELLIYSCCLDDVNHAAVLAYLAGKYGI